MFGNEFENFAAVAADLRQEGGLRVAEQSVPFAAIRSPEYTEIQRSSQGRRLERADEGGCGPVIALPGADPPLGILGVPRAAD
jgi:hypothetical protein